MEKKPEPVISWYVDLESLTIEAPNREEANKKARELLYAEKDRYEPVIGDVGLARIECCGEEMEDIFETIPISDNQVAPEQGRNSRLTGYKCRKCGATVPIDKLG